MKFNAKEYFKLSAIYTLIGAFPPILQILIQPIIEGKDRLNAIEFSKMAIAESITTLAFVIALYSMGNAISRFYYDYKDSKENYNKLVSSIFNSILLRGLLLFGLALIFGDYIGKLFNQIELQDFSSYGYATIIIGVNRAINITAAALYRNEKRVSTFIVLNVALGVFRAIFQVVGVLYYDMSFIGYVYGTAIGTSFTSISILVYTYYKSGVKLDFKILNNVNKFARPLFQYGIISWGILFADRYFLESSPLELGIYDTALKFALGIQMIIQGLQGAMQPEIFRLMKEGVSKTQEDIKKYSHLFLAQSQILIALAIIPTMLYINYLFESEVKLAATLVSILFVKYILRVQYNVFSLVVYYEKRTKFFFYVNLFVLVINLSLNYYLVPIYKAYGAISAAFVSELILLITVYFYQKTIADIKWNINKSLIFPLGIVAVTIGLEIIKNLYNLNIFVSAIVITITIFTSIILLYKQELKGLIDKYLYR